MPHREARGALEPDGGTVAGAVDRRPWLGAVDPLADAAAAEESGAGGRAGTDVEAGVVAALGDVDGGAGRVVQRRARELLAIETLVARDDLGLRQHRACRCQQRNDANGGSWITVSTTGELMVDIYYQWFRRKPSAAMAGAAESPLRSLRFLPLLGVRPQRTHLRCYFTAGGVGVPHSSTYGRVLISSRSKPLGAGRADVAGARA
jgi:hypothetical protein